MDACSTYGCLHAYGVSLHAVLLQLAPCERHITLHALASMPMDLRFQSEGGLTNISNDSTR
jgi:hypothetical protein